MDPFPQENFETNVHRSCFYDHCIILQAHPGQVCASPIFIPFMSQLGSIYSKYLINTNQMSGKVGPGRVAILGETKRDGDGNEIIKKSFIKECYIIVEQNELHLLFKCKLIIEAALIICTCHALFPTSSSHCHSAMTVSFLVNELTYSHCHRGSPMISPKSFL